MEIHRCGTLAELGAHLKTSHNVNLWLGYLYIRDKREQEKYKAMMGGDNS
jgi:hypothetical protein